MYRTSQTSETHTVTLQCTERAPRQTSETDTVTLQCTERVKNLKQTQ